MTHTLPETARLQLDATRDHDIAVGRPVARLGRLDDALHVLADARAEGGAAEEEVAALTRKGRTG